MTNPHQTPTTAKDKVENIIYSVWKDDNRNVLSLIPGQATDQILQIIDQALTDTVVAVDKDDNNYDTNDGRTHAVRDYALGWNDCRQEIRQNLGISE